VRLSTKSSCSSVWGTNVENTKCGWRTHIAWIFSLSCSWLIIVVQTLSDIIIIIIIISLPHLELYSVWLFATVRGLFQVCWRRLNLTNSRHSIDFTLLNRHYNIADIWNFLPLERGVSSRQETRILTLHTLVVTICTTSLTFNNSKFCTHSVFMFFFVWIWEQKAIISLHNINWLGFITEI